MSKTKKNANSGITFKQGLQLFFVRKILDDRYTMGSLVGSERGNEFFRQWSHIVCEGREKDKDFQCSVKVPEDFGKVKPEEEQEKEIVLNVQGKQVRKRVKKGGTELSFAPPAYHPLLQNPRFSGLLNLLADEELGELMRISYPAEAEAAEIAAVVGTSKDADIIREAIARNLGKKPDGLNDEDYGNIKELDLSGSDISDLEPIKGLSSLKGLYLGGTQVSDLEPIKGLSSLRGLDLNRTQVSDLEPIKGLSSLVWLALSDTEVSNIEPIKGLSSLERLDLSDTQVSDLEPIKGLSSLQKLWLVSTQVSNLEPIKGLSSLQGLNLDETRVSDLEPIKELSNLQELVLTFTRVRNLEPIKGLSSLRELFLEGTQVADEQVVELQQTLPELEISR